jgi:hypothetical protein
VVATGTCLFTDIAWAGPITFVQGHYEYANVRPLAKITVPYTLAQTPGDLNVVIVGWRDGLAQITSVTDTNGNPYQVGAQINDLTFPIVLQQAIFYSSNILAAVAGGNTVTVKFSSPATAADIRTLEYGGIDPVSPFYLTSTSAGVNAFSRSGNLIIYTAPVLLVAANTVGPHTLGPTGGFTQRLLSRIGDSAEDRVVTALTGSHSFNAGANLADVGPWLTQMVIFRGADAPP